MTKTFLKTLGRNDLFLGLATAVPLVAIGAGTMGTFGGFMAGFTSAFHAMSRRRLINTLESRLSENSLLMDVHVDHVVVGTFSEAEYARLSLSVLNDWSTYAAQARNLAYVVRRMLNVLIVGIPLALFWVGLAMAWYDPDIVAATFAELRELTPTAMRAQVVSLLPMVQMAVTFALACMLPLGTRFGFVNIVGERIGEAVCHYLGVVAAAGDVVLVGRPGRTKTRATEPAPH